jgi:hypothetical protein
LTDERKWPDPLKPGTGRRIAGSNQAKRGFGRNQNQAGKVTLNVAEVIPRRCMGRVSSESPNPMMRRWIDSSASKPLERMP